VDWVRWEFIELLVCVMRSVVISGHEARRWHCVHPVPSSFCGYGTLCYARLAPSSKLSLSSILGSILPSRAQFESYSELFGPTQGESSRKNNTLFRVPQRLRRHHTTTITYLATRAVPGLGTMSVGSSFNIAYRLMVLSNGEAVRTTPVYYLRTDLTQRSSILLQR
jgi:hypothetical protein